MKKALRRQSLCETSEAPRLLGGLEPCPYAIFSVAGACFSVEYVNLLINSSHTLLISISVSEITDSKTLLLHIIVCGYSGFSLKKFVAHNDLIR